MPWEAANLPAILQAWYPGQAGGTAVARVLFGDCNPSGRLPVTFYRATTDLPAFADYSMANRTYRFFTASRCSRSDMDSATPNSIMAPPSRPGGASRRQAS